MRPSTTLQIHTQNNTSDPHNPSPSQKGPGFYKVNTATDGGGGGGGDGESVRAPSPKLVPMPLPVPSDDGKTGSRPKLMEDIEGVVYNPEWGCWE